jgi:superfamily II DNA or RNA helicase
MKGMGEFLFDDEAWPTTTVKREYKPRPYQTDAATLAAEALASAAACGLYMATGLGKTEVAALLFQMEWEKRGKVLLTPRRELVVQSAERLRSRGIPCGVEMAEQRSYEDVTVGCYASFQSRKRYERFLGTTGILIVDESHLNYTPSAIQMINQFKEWGAKVVGMTATPNTGKKNPLVRTYGEAAFIYDYLRAQADGWLCPARIYMTVLEDLDLSEWSESWRGGEVCDPADGKPKNSYQVGAMLARKSNVTAVCAMVERYYEGKPSVVFAMTIAHAEEIQRELLARGITAAIVHSKMEDHERRLHLDMFESGRADVIVNVGCLTLGWDSPRVKKLFIARPTKSQALYIQMFGRATRCEPGLVDRYESAADRIAAIAASSKPYMEVFDFTDTTRHNDLKSAMDVLHPSLDKRLLRRLRNRMPRILNTADAVALDPILDEERRLLAAEEAEHARQEYERRSHLTGRADFTAYERSVFADAEKPERGGKPDYWWMPFGKYRGRSFGKIPTWYLRSIMPHCKDEGLRRNISRHLANRPA